MTIEYGKSIAPIGISFEMDFEGKNVLCTYLPSAIGKLPSELQITNEDKQLLLNLHLLKILARTRLSKVDITKGYIVITGKDFKETKVKKAKD